MTDEKTHYNPETKQTTTEEVLENYSDYSPEDLINHFLEQDPHDCAQEAAQFLVPKGGLHREVIESDIRDRVLALQEMPNERHQEHLLNSLSTAFKEYDEYQKYL